MSAQTRSPLALSHAFLSRRWHAEMACLETSFIAPFSSNKKPVRSRVYKLKHSFLSVCVLRPPALEKRDFASHEPPPPPPPPCPDLSPWKDFLERSARARTHTVCSWFLQGNLRPAEKVARAERPCIPTPTQKVAARAPLNNVFVLPFKCFTLIQTSLSRSRILRMRCVFLVFASYGANS